MTQLTPQLESGPLGRYVPSRWGNRFHAVCDREHGLIAQSGGQLVNIHAGRFECSGISPHADAWTVDSQCLARDLKPGDSILDHELCKWDITDVETDGGRLLFKATRKKQITTMLGAGAAGPGKTVVLLRDPLFQMLREKARTALPPGHPHWIPMGESSAYALFLRRTTPQLEDIWKQAQRVFPKWDPDVKFEAKTYTAVFSVGMRYQFGHCHEADDWQRYMGVAKTRICWDELITFLEEQFNTVNMWLRSSDPVLVHDLAVRAATNPVFVQPKNAGNIVVTNPFWVRDRFVEPEPKGNVIIRKRIDLDGETIERTEMYMPATLEDNPDPLFRRSYKAQIADRPKHVQRALIYGDWYAQPGGYFEHEWDEEIHTCEPFAIPSHWTKWRAMDWGYKTHGVVGWFAEDPDTGTFYLFREFSFILTDVPKVSAVIEHVETEMSLWHNGQSLINGAADTQLWERRGERARTKADVFRDHGIVWEYATKERIPNGMAVAARLRSHNDRSQPAGLIIFKSCEETIRRFPNIQADIRMPEMPVKGGQDHWFDMVCYGVRFGESGGVQDHEVMREMIDMGHDIDGDEDGYGADGYGGY